MVNWKVIQITKFCPMLYNGDPDFYEQSMDDLLNED